MQSSLRQLEAIVNGRFHSKRARCVSVLCNKRVHERSCRRVLSSESAWGEALPRAKPSARATDLTIPAYAGDNQVVRAMGRALDRAGVLPYLEVFVHGSLGTYEDVEYSDFDAMAVISRRALEAPILLARCTRALHEALRFMALQDPLQHHGWFLLTEYDYLRYPEYYLPVAALRESKRVGHRDGLSLAIHAERDIEASRASFQRICSSIVRDTTSRKHARNAYHFKSVVSRVLLLPATYLQARDGCGVFKGESFAIAESLLPEPIRHLVEVASQIRRDWSLDLSPLRARLLSMRPPLRTYLGLRFAPSTPPDLLHRLDTALEGTSKLLIDLPALASRSMSDASRDHR